MKNKFIFYTIGIIIGILVAPLKMNSILIGILILFLIPFTFELDFKRLFIFLFLMIISFSRTKNFEHSYLNEYDGKYIRYIAIVEDTNYKNSQKIRLVSINNKTVDQYSLLHTEEKLEIGNIITGVAQFQLPYEKMNPTDFNQKSYLARQNIKSTLKTQSSINKIGESTSYILKIKRSLLNYLRDIPLKGQNKELILRIFTGRSELNRDLKDTIESLGISHIIAISGLHIGLFIFIAMFFTRWVHRRILFPFVLLMIGIYAYTIGFPPSMKRALTFTLLLYLCEVFHLIHDDKDILWITLSIILLLNPYELYSPGLQFSFLATMVILKNLSINKENEILKIIKTSILISMILIPLQIYYFNEFHLGFLIGNLFIVPIFTAIISISFMGYILFPFKTIIFKCLNPIINFLWIIVFGGSILSKTIKIRFFTIKGIILFYLSIFLYTKRSTFYNLKLKTLNTILKTYYITMIFSVLFNILLDPLTVKVFYMGQEDASLIEYRNKKILYDVGGNPFSNENNSLKAYLDHYGIQKIDGAILSHYDLDHIGNLSSLSDKIIYILSRTDGKEELQNLIGSIPFQYIELGQKDFIKEGLMEYTFYINENGFSENDKSLVLQLQHFNCKILFTGDIQEETEKFLVEEDLSSNILMVPHHGSNTSSTENFINCVNPEVAIISSGINNRFKFPHQDVLERYKNRNVKIYQTKDDGMIEIYSNRLGWKIKASKVDYYEEFLIILIYIYSIAYIALLEKEINNELIPITEFI